MGSPWPACAMSLCAACSFPGNAPVTDGAPGGDGPSRVDGGIDAIQVDAGPLGPWGAPVIAAGLESASSDDDPTLTVDLLEIYWNSSRAGGAGGGDIWRATRGSVGAPWQNLVAVAELNTTSLESTPKLTVDGLTIYFNSDRPGGPGSFDIYMSTRPNTSSAWTPPVLIPELSTGSADYGAAPGETNFRIVFNSDRAGAAGGSLDLYQSNRSTVTATWGTPARISALSETSNEYVPMLVDGDRTIYFQSDRGGSDDIYIAVRPTTGQPFMPPVRIDELSTPNTDADPWVSPDERTIFFASDRDGEMAIYEASR